MSDFEQCLKRLQPYLMLFCVNLSYELGIIVTRYDFLEIICMTLTKWSNQLQLYLISIWKYWTKIVCDLV